MRQITKEALRAFLLSKNFRKSNMDVTVSFDKTVLRLFGNEIAYIKHDDEKTLLIRNAGWFSKTTKERLNALPNVNIENKRGDWFLNGQKWDGKTIKVGSIVNFKEEYLKRMQINGEALRDLGRFVELTQMSVEDFIEEVLV